jgi:hypothetical protein
MAVFVACGSLFVAAAVFVLVIDLAGVPYFTLDTFDTLNLTPESVHVESDGSPLLSA